MTSLAWFPAIVLTAVAAVAAVAVVAVIPIILIAEVVFGVLVLGWLALVAYCYAPKKSKAHGSTQGHRLEPGIGTR